MEVTKMESVTRIYCDVCKQDITNSNRYGDTNADGSKADICTGGGHPSCYDKWKFARDYIAGDHSFQ